MQTISTPTSLVELDGPRREAPAPLPDQHCRPALGNTRDQKIDFWRGLCIVGMVSWHLLSHRSYPGWLSFPVIQSFNFVAEGFVLLAGTVIGLRLARPPAPPPARGYLRRAVLILLLHYAIVACMAAAFTATDFFEQYPEPRSLAQWVADILTLTYQPYLGDILSLFAFLFASVPVCFLILRHAGSAGLLLTSVSIYLLALAAPHFCAVNGGGAFVFNSWQLYFVLGILFGKHYPAVLQAAQKNTWPYLVLAGVLFLAASAFRLALKMNSELRASLPNCLLDERHPLTLLRTFYILCQLLIIGLLTARFWHRLAGSRVVRWFSDFGAHSMLVFVGSIFLDYLFKGLLSKWGWGFPRSLLAWGLEIALLYALVHFARTLRVRRPPPVPALTPAG